MTPGKHAEPKQHPFAQDVALHVQEPLTHCWPVAHAAPVPHAQAPAALQPSASAGLHEVHALPPTPHVESEGGVSHVLPLQHPVRHVTAQPAHAW